MSIVPLLAALVPWAGSPVALITRIFLAVSILSVEMQLVSWSGVGTLQTIWIANLGLAAGLAAWQWRRQSPFGAWNAPAWATVPWMLVAPLGVLVAALNLLLPLEAADPYHLDRVAQILRLGTLNYDIVADPKVNVVGWLYELVLADLQQIPFVGNTLLQLHGVLGFGLYVTTIAAVQQFLPPGAQRWPSMLLFVVPVVFHQFVLIKNDLFLLAPMLVALTWMVTTRDRARWQEALWAGWLTGLVVATKVTGFPLAIVLVAGVLVATKGREWRVLAAVCGGGAIGGATGGLFFSMTQNLQWYGDPLAMTVLDEIGNMDSSLSAVATSAFRYALSLVDLGFLTPALWPGRGGWGSTFGLPLIWALGVLALSYRRSAEVRWAVWTAAAGAAGYALIFPDADISHRINMTPGLLVMAMALFVVGSDQKVARYARLVLVPVLVLSGAQIVRSAVLYLVRS